MGLPGRIYPALVRAPGGAAEGLVLLGLSRFERQVLDYFEGAEYARGIVPVVVDMEVHEADAYLPSMPVAADSEVWSLALWRRDHKASVLAEDGAEAAAIRARLRAARPN